MCRRGRNPATRRIARIRAADWSCGSAGVDVLKLAEGRSVELAVSATTCSTSRSCTPWVISTTVLSSIGFSDSESEYALPSGHSLREQGETDRQQTVSPFSRSRTGHWSGSSPAGAAPGCPRGGTRSSSVGAATPVRSCGPSSQQPNYRK